MKHVTTVFRSPSKTPSSRCSRGALSPRRGVRPAGVGRQQWHAGRTAWLHHTVLFTALSSLLLTVAGQAAQERPNVLYIFTDQQHAGMMSCAGNPWLKTPAMDSIAHNGARFERAYAVNPVCVPSRTGMWTGYTPSRFGMQSNNDLATTKIPDDYRRQTLGELCRQAGYKTLYGGKTHVPGKIEDYGFEVLTSDQRGGLAEACATFLKQSHDKPFLLVASFINPHDICYMAINAFEAAKTASKPAKKGKASKADKKANEAQRYLAEAMKRPAGVSEQEFYRKWCPPLPANYEMQENAPEAVRTQAGFRQYAFENWGEKEWRLHRWAYCRLTEVVDREIGKVLQALREAGLEEKTVIVFSSDHGDMDGAHRLEHKSLFFEEAARVPFLVSWKGVTKPGLVNRRHLVSSGMDLIPTLCDYAGIGVPHGMLGRSVRALAEGREPKEWRPYVVSETRFGRMVCSGRYKYCVYETGTLREQLVDLEKDPGEMKNVAADPSYAEVLARHRNYMKEWVTLNQDKFAATYIIK